ncbi:hypothetical protein DL771_004751 [Monosporascus sp. 5C6A]|nr:hypothetical protein DL771_004751 [Monosporascus sp. 5C6A]
MPASTTFAAIGDSYAAGIGAGDRLGSLLGVLDRQVVVFAKTAATVDKEYQWAKDVDWDSLGCGYNVQLDRTESIINSDAFSGNIDKVLDAAKAKLPTTVWSTIRVTASPSAKTSHRSMTPYLGRRGFTSYNIWEPRKTLMADLRRRINELVDAANEKLDLTVFYELNTADPPGNAPWKRSNHKELQGTFAGDVDILAKITVMMDPDAELVQGDKVETDNTTTPTGGAFVETLEKGIHVEKFLPEGYGRVLHPPILLHEIIANLVVYNMINHNQEKNGLPRYPEVFPRNGRSRVFRPVGPVNPDNFEKAADEACDAFSIQGVKKPGKVENRNAYVYQTRDGDTPLWISIGWKRDCTLPGNVMQQQNMRYPLGGGSDACSEMFKDDIFWSCGDNVDAAVPSPRGS